MTPARADHWGRWLPWVLFAGALALRLYRLPANPLWLDELYGVQLGRLGLGAVLANSLADPHPPLNYVLLWLGSGLAAARSEWAYRWIAALAGAATVPLVYSLARRWAGVGAAALAALMLLLSPAHLYYSQEARAYASAMVLAALSAWLLLTDRLRPPARWRWWAAVTAAGLLLDYAYLMVAGVQAVFALALARRQPGAWRALVVVALVVAVIAPWAAVTLPVSARAFVGEPLRLWSTAQALTGGDLARYGPLWAHAWLAGGLALVGGLGVWQLARRAADPWALYAPAQWLLPLGAFFLVVSPLFGVNLHAYDARQFLVLLPAALVTAAAGLEQSAAWLRQAGAWLGGLRAAEWLAAAAGLALLTGLAAASAAGLLRYWEQSKSPEGEVARFVRDHGPAGAAVVSLHYSVDAALSFYAPDAPAYFTKPQRTDRGVFFADTLSVQLRDWRDLPRPHPLAEISAYPRRWVAWEQGSSDELAAQLTAGCAPVPGAAAAFGPFQVMLVDGCPVR
ncbi:MAG: glycosyltransferase family 39 protein [Anaerolineales bacterium]|nr:glycosyltransferase family 39 protein [Anaerolineales bacterium]